MQYNMPRYSENSLNIDYWYGLATLAEKCDVALLQSELDDVERCDWLIDV